jgi:hypothetical protein
MNIIKVIAVHQYQSVDLLWIKTDLPPTFPNIDPSSLVITIQLQAGTAEDYCRTAFNREPDEVVSL